MLPVPGAHSESHQFRRLMYSESYDFSWSSNDLGRLFSFTKWFQLSSPARLLHSLLDMFISWPYEVYASVIPVSCLSFLPSPKKSFVSDRKLYLTTSQRNLIFLSTPCINYLYLFWGLSPRHITFLIAFYPSRHPLLPPHCLKAQLKWGLLGIPGFSSCLS